MPAGVAFRNKTTGILDPDGLHFPDENGTIFYETDPEHYIWKSFK